MSIIVRQSTAITVALGPFLDSVDGNTVESGFTITQPDVRLSKNGATFAQKSAAQTLSHMENGYYSLSLSTTDTDTVGSLRIHCHESGGLPVWEEYQVIEEAVYDAYFAASATGLLPANVTQVGGVAVTATGGRQEVNLSHIAGAAVSTTTAQLGVNAVQAAGTAWNSGAIGAATLAADTIAAAKIATGAITSAKFAAGAIDAAAIAADAIAATKIATGAITAAKFAAGAIDAAAIATGALTAAKFAAGAFDAVWSVTARLLTAGTNIVLAKGVGVTGFNDLSAAAVNAEADTAIADAALATAANLATAAGYIDTEVAAIKAKTDQLTFGVTNTVNANIESVNAIAIVGDGAATPWGP